MMGESAKIDWESMDSALPAFLTIILMPLTYSITNGMVFGMAFAFFFYITTGSAFRDIMKILKGERRQTSDTRESWNNRESEEAVFLSMRMTKDEQEEVTTTDETEGLTLDTTTQGYGAVV